MIYKARFDTYNKAKTDFEKLRDAYNDLVTYADQRNSDLLHQILQAPTVLPERPCKPDVPTQYTGIKAYFGTDKKMSAFGNAADGEIQNKWGVLNEGIVANDPTPVVASTLKTGFLQASINTGAQTDAEIQNVGHIFGRMGQGERTMPEYTLNGVKVKQTAF